jgi:hypothetical protein
LELALFTLEELGGKRMLPQTVKPEPHRATSRRCFELSPTIS